MERESEILFEYLVVQNRSLFNDQAEKINTLTHSIKEDITFLNNRLENLQVCAYKKIFLLLSCSPSFFFFLRVILL